MRNSLLICGGATALTMLCASLAAAIAFGELAALSILYSTPVILLYILIARRLGGGFTLGGAVKG